MEGLLLDSWEGWEEEGTCERSQCKESRRVVRVMSRAKKTDRNG